MAARFIGQQWAVRSLSKVFNHGPVRFPLQSFTASFSKAGMSFLLTLATVSFRVVQFIVGQDSFRYFAHVAMAVGHQYPISGGKFFRLPEGHQ